ncbi:MAG: amidohydrolase family protein [Pseudomonadota bacterium]
MLRGANHLLGVPDGSIDGHAHVFEQRLPMVSGRRYTPTRDAGLSEFVDHLTRHGLNGGLLVQPSFLGTDNSYLLAALQAVAEQKRHLCVRGVATLTEHAGRAEIKELSKAGIVGARFNLFGLSDSTAFDIAPWKDTLLCVRDAGWHVELHCEGPRIAALLPMLLAHADRIVIDHFGLPDAVEPLDCPGHKAIIAAPAGRVFVKASAPYRVFRAVPSMIAARRCAPIFHSLMDALGPDQLIWGSDWPWTQFEGAHRYETTMHWLDLWQDRHGDASSTHQIRDGRMHENVVPPASISSR